MPRSTNRKPGPILAYFILIITAAGVATFIGWYYLIREHRSKNEMTMAKIATIHLFVQHYYETHGTLPTESEWVQRLTSEFGPVDTRDLWGRPFTLNYQNENTIIASMGPDGVPSDDDIVLIEAVPTEE